MGKHGTEYARAERDLYPTPAWVIAALAEHVDLRGLTAWEPACGDGRMAEALRAAGCARVYTSDIVDRGNGLTRPLTGQGRDDRRANLTVIIDRIEGSNVQEVRAIEEVLAALKPLVDRGVRIRVTRSQQFARAPVYLYAMFLRTI